MAETYLSPDESFALLPVVLHAVALDEVSFNDRVARFQLLESGAQGNIEYEAAQRVSENPISDTFGVEHTGAAFMIAKLQIMDELDAQRIALEQGHAA